ncbi:hypothetical protein [Stenotrophomonas sp. PD6]|uniref:hypothetical protein n=1 Tax=Stenotrophomonas sp. PD6 TaxID=3368612 RepID=UPI003BA2AF5E
MSLHTRLSRCLVVAASLLLVQGCTSIGPKSIPRDRIEYSTVMGDSWKEQTLLNIVRLRYVDAPVFLDVSSVISSYTVEGQVDLRGNFFGGSTPNNQSLGGYGRYTDKPTISYTPLTGEKFSRSLLQPIPPVAVFSMIQAGYPADFILRATVRGMNGRYNRATGVNHRPAEPEFEALAEAMRRIQLSQGLGMRIERRDGQDVTLLFFHGASDPALQADIATVVRLLGVTPPLDEITLTYGAIPRNSKEIAVQTRSMLEILIEFADGIDVPADHIARGRTYPGTLQSAAAAENPPLALIHSGTERPAQAYAQVRYRDAWYWIDDTDLRSKRAFTFMMMFFSLAETGVSPQTPVITVGAN